MRNDLKEWKSSLFEDTNRHLFYWAINRQIYHDFNHRNLLFRCQLRDDLLTRFDMFLIHEISFHFKESLSIYN